VANGLVVGSTCLGEPVHEVEGQGEHCGTRTYPLSQETNHHITHDISNGIIINYDEYILVSMFHVFIMVLHMCVLREDRQEGDQK